MQRTASKTKKTKSKIVLKGSRMLPPKKSEEMYVTLKHLNVVEAKLASQITGVLVKTVANNEGIHHLNKRVDSLKSEISSKFSKVDDKFKCIDRRFDEIDQQFREVDKKFAEIKEILSTIVTKINHTLAVVEEQNSRNLYVLDGYAYLISEQQKLHRRVDLLEKTKPSI